jgi:uroporphyrinogen-III synthase
VVVPPQTLAGRRIIVTRERPGHLAELLMARGADVIHIPSIAVGDPPDGGAALRRELERLDDFDWLVVTSPEGARRVGAAAAGSRVRLAAVGGGTAQSLAECSGRTVEVIPSTQRAEHLAAAIVTACDDATTMRALVAQADLASGETGGLLRARGVEVVEVTAYSTISIDTSAGMSIGSLAPGHETAPGQDVATAVAIGRADAVLFASGSAVQGWVAAFGARTPPVAVAIGPSTAAVAGELGLDITGIAADHSIDGLVTAVEAHLA